jgi:DNA invertase Pin-like site-specific DNA recombinase
MALVLTAAEPPDDLFALWLRQAPGRTRARGRQTRMTPGSIQFAFYGRMSTTGYQDPASSRHWQYDNAARLIAGNGVVAAEFFDAGFSRSLPWHQRPAAAELLMEAVRPDRRFGAVVIGEFERAFTGGQAQQIIAYLQAHGVTVWLPEADGPIDRDEPAHQALLMLLGHQSEREVLRFRMGTTTAMRAQAREQDRHLGGRPPYGYRLVDAGPHPNKTHAAWGRPGRRHPRRRRHRDRAQRRPDTPHEFDHGTLGADLPPGTSGPEANLEPAASAPCTAGVRAVL